MSVRIAQRQMYTSYLLNMNGSLSSLMDSHLQASSMKKVNKPSDDPYGMAQIMASTRHLDALVQYKDNLGMAKGWLSQCESTFGLVHEDLNTLFSLLEQGATGTLSKEQRDIIATQARGIYEQMINYSNTRFNGRSIFSGHKTDDSAFSKALGITCHDSALDSVQYRISGDANKTILIQFTQTGDISSTDCNFRYTLDGGETWANGSWNAGPPRTMVAGSVQIEPIFSGVANVTAVDPDNVNETNNGTWVYVRPTAVYNGDTNDSIVIQSYNNSSGVTGTAKGTFTRDVSVRVEGIGSGVIQYSYSMDDGQTWTSASAPDAPPYDLPLPNGFLTLSGVPAVGDQYIVHPERANIDLNIGTNATITVNYIGKDVFGGIYAPPFSINGPQPAMSNQSQNLFEVIGEAIAALETNSQQGVQEALVKVKSVIEYIGRQRSSVGARMNRVEAIAQQLETLKLDESERLSGLEDVDVAELLTRLSQQQLVYNSVLKSSSMIMQMSLMNFL